MLGFGIIDTDGRQISICTTMDDRTEIDIDERIRIGAARTRRSLGTNTPFRDHIAIHHIMQPRPSPPRLEQARHGRTCGAGRFGPVCSIRRHQLPRDQGSTSASSASNLSPRPAPSNRACQLTGKEYRWEGGGTELKSAFYPPSPRKHPRAHTYALLPISGAPSSPASIAEREEEARPARSPPRRRERGLARQPPPSPVK